MLLGKLYPSAVAAATMLLLPVDAVAAEEEAEAAVEGVVEEVVVEEVEGATRELLRLLL